jgi:hypothetical protein
MMSQTLISFVQRYKYVTAGVVAAGVLVCANSGYAQTAGETPSSCDYDGCYKSMGITGHDVCRRHAEYEKNPVTFRENSFNRFPKPETKEPVGYFQKYLLSNPPDGQTLMAIKNSFGKVAVLKVKVGNYILDDMFKPAGDRYTGLGVYRDVYISSCVWEYWEITHKYGKFNHFYIDELVEDEHKIIQGGSRYFTGFRNPRHSSGFRKPGYITYDQNYFAMMNCKAKEEGYSGRSFYVIVYQDPDLKYQGPIEFKNGQYRTPYKKLPYAPGTKRWDEKDAEFVEENAYALIGLDGDFTTDPEEGALEEILRNMGNEDCYYDDHFGL